MMHTNGLYTLLTSVSLQYTTLTQPRSVVACRAHVHRLVSKERMTWLIARPSPPLTLDASSFILCNAIWSPGPALNACAGAAPGPWVGSSPSAPSSADNVVRGSMTSRCVLRVLPQMTSCSSLQSGEWTCKAVEQGSESQMILLQANEYRSTTCCCLLLNPN